MKGHVVKEIERRFKEYGVTGQLVCDIRDIVAGEQYLARENIVEVEDPDLGRVKVQNVVPRFSETPGKVRYLGLSLGTSNQEIYGEWLGLLDEELAELKRQKII